MSRTRMLRRRARSARGASGQLLIAVTGSLRRGTRIASRAGRGIAVGLMILGGLEIFAGALAGGVWLILIGLFLRGTAEAGYQNLVIRQSLEDVEVSEVAIPEPVTVSPMLTLQALVDDYFLALGYRAYPVVEGSTVKGLVSIDALRAVHSDAWRSTLVSDVMTPASEANEATPGEPLSQALARLAGAPTGRLLVRDPNGRLTGLLTKEGLARFLEIRRVLERGGGRSAPGRGHRVAA